MDSYIGVYCSINYLVEVDCYKNYGDIGKKAKIGAKGMFYIQCNTLTKPMQLIKNEIPKPYEIFLTPQSIVIFKPFFVVKL
jgi:hypothetical protein